MGRPAIVQLLRRKWTRELDYRLVKELWAFTENRIAVRFAYEWRDDSGQWHRSYGNENWEFAHDGLMQCRLASIARDCGSRLDSGDVLAHARIHCRSTRRETTVEKSPL